MVVRFEVYELRWVWGGIKDGLVVVVTSVVCSGEDFDGVGDVVGGRSGGEVYWRLSGGGRIVVNF